MATFRVARVDAVTGESAYYADDLLAIRAGAERDGFAYRGDPVTPGHTAIRSAGRAILLRLSTDEGAAGWGDAVSVQYSGVGGRDAPLDPVALEGQIELARSALLEAGPLDFVSGSRLIEELRLDDAQLHTGLRYGLSQALLNAEAAATGTTALRVLAAETGLTTPRLLPVYGQTGDDRHTNADRMILRGVEILPHGLFNSPMAFGADGGLFLEYVHWLRARVDQLGAPGYRPSFHFDVYGLLGLMTDRDVPRMAAFLADVERAGGGMAVAVESPCFTDDTTTTIELLAALRAELRTQGTSVRIVADEFCNGDEDVARFVAADAVDLIQIKMPDLGCLTEALDAVRTCREGGLGVFIGGSCSETEVSAVASAHLAMSVDADQVLAKPGMGVDEGITIVRNTMRRAVLDWELAEA